MRKLICFRWSGGEKNPVVKRYEVCILDSYAVCSVNLAEMLHHVGESFPNLEEFVFRSKRRWHTVHPMHTT